MADRHWANMGSLFGTVAVLSSTLAAQPSDWRILLLALGVMFFNAAAVLRCRHIQSDQRKDVSS